MTRVYVFLLACCALQKTVHSSSGDVCPDGLACQEIKSELDEVQLLQRVSFGDSSLAAESTMQSQGAQNNMKGWDMIAVAEFDALNEQLLKLPPVSVKTQVQVPMFGKDINVDIDVSLGSPQIGLLQGSVSGKELKVTLATAGSIDFNFLGKTSVPLTGNILSVTTQLLAVKSEIQPNPDTSDYDFLIDTQSPDAIVDMKFIKSTDYGTTSLIITAVKKMLQDKMKRPTSWRVATFQLAKVPEFLKAKLADYTFVENTNTADKSQMMVLMQSIAKTEGGLLFDAPLLPEGSRFGMLVSSNMMMEQAVRPALVEQLKKKAKNPETVDSQIVTSTNSDGFIEITNNGPILVKQDHDPWIEKVTAKMATDMKAIYFYLDAKADVTFMNIHVDTWTKSWQQFAYDESTGAITLKEIKTDSHSSRKEEWWKWIVSFPIGALNLALFEVIQAKLPSMKGTFSDISLGNVKWPEQKTVKLKSITTPGNIQMIADVSF